MSEFHVHVVRLGKIGKHPNADALSITSVYQYPVIFRTGDFQPGDLAVYVPVDAIVPADDPRWAFLAGHNRIKARRLRGIFSMGVLIKPEPGWVEGQNVQLPLGIVKWEPNVAYSHGNAVPTPPWFVKYTDIEGLRRFPNVLKEGEEVIITEKIHGANSRWAFKDGKLYVGSHNQLLAEDDYAIWWKVAHEHDFARRLATADGIIFFGETYGDVQDLKYGCKPGTVNYAMFDAYDSASGRYLDYDDFVELCARLGLKRVPVLYRGPWNEDCRKLCEGKSTIAANIREGFVVKPVRERYEHSCGRVILKLIGEGYYERKGA